MKLNVNELKVELEGKEIDFIDLDNFMMTSGYYSVFDDGATEYIKEGLNVAYTAKDTCEVEIIIHFEITIENGEDEIPESFELKVLKVDQL